MYSLEMYFISLSQVQYGVKEPGDQGSSSASIAYYMIWHKVPSLSFSNLTAVLNGYTYEPIA